MSTLLSDFINNRLETVQFGGVVDGATQIILEDDNIRQHESDDDDFDQSEYVERELLSYSKFTKVQGTLTDIDYDAEEDEIMEENEFYRDLTVPQAFTKYNFESFYKNALPIDGFKTKILNLIATNSVIIIHGPTGCGKTTQVPQYIVDECREENLPCNIVVTQPRRIAAMNIAQRVCTERGWALGTVCGYQVGLNKNVGEDVILTYMTTEVLLQKLLLQKNLNRYTHIIVDEVHERNKALDFLLLIVRKFLYTNSNTVKIILMSATMEADKFSHYFRSISRNCQDSFLLAPVLHVDKKLDFITNICYADQLATIGKIAEYDIQSPTIAPETYKLCLALIIYFNKIDEINHTTGQKIIGSVLVFLPGYHEIEEMHQQLSKAEESKQWTIVPLHSSLASDHLAKAFEPPLANMRKIILSTNIAESSVTVPDVYYVIDFCLTKVMTMNSETRFSSLQLQWAAHNNCIQRAGRVGRVANGRVYRLVPKDFYKNQMPDTTLPELQRSPLENIILYMKLLELNDTPKNVLSLALDPPNLKDVDTCVWHLKEVGALLTTCRGRQSSADGDLTLIGRIMGNIPLDIHLTKLIILGHMFSCLEETVIMAAGAATKNLFNKNFFNKLQSYSNKLLWADGSCSDFIALLNLHKVWLSKKRHHAFRNISDEYTWCRKNFVNLKGLREWELLIKEIHNRLKTFKIETPVGMSRVNLDDGDKPLILKIIICGAFYPNYFLRSTEFGQIDIREAVKLLNGRDPYSTVYFTNMEINQPGQIYVRQIKKLLEADNNASIGFDTNGTKIFVQYNSVKHPEPVTVNGHNYIASVGGNIPPDVYTAIRRRQIRTPFELNLLPSKKAWEFYENCQNRFSRQTSNEDDGCFSNLTYNPLPTLDVEYISLIITHIIDPGHFYSRNYNPETNRLSERIARSLNGEPLDNVRGEVQKGEKLYAARYEDDNMFYRCKIVAVNQRPIPMAQVFYIDYGNIEAVPVSELCELPNTEICQSAPLAICCTLCNVRPSTTSNGLWSDKAIRDFKTLTHRLLLHGKIYSVVNNVVSMELFDDRNYSSSFNQYLVNHQLAEKCEESYLSKLDHDRRLQVLASENPNNTAKQMESVDVTSFKDFESPDLEFREDSTKIVLKGPFSPLETKLHGLVQATASTSINVDSDSVNTVLLDDKPEDPFARLLVAGGIGQSSGSQRITLYDTTLMPSIPGFPAMMLLLFCPTMEPKTNDEGTKICSILCGLGYKESSKAPNYPTHDISYTLDVVLDKKLIKKVNELRFIMNALVECMNNIYSEIAYPDEIYSYQRSLKEKICSLYRMKCEPLTKEIAKYPNVWGRHACEDMEMIHVNIAIEKPIWPMHWFIQLNTGNNIQLHVQDNLKKLKDIAKRLIPEEEITCLLCSSGVLRRVADVRHHLIQDCHKTNEQKLKN